MEIDIDSEIESRRKWLKAQQPEYLAAKADVEAGRETEAVVAAFRAARILIVDEPPPKSGEEALYRMGRLRAMFERATSRSEFVAAYDAELEGYKALEKAKKERTFRSPFDVF